MKNLILIRKENQIFPVIAVAIIAMIAGIYMITSLSMWQMILGIIFLLTGPVIIFTHSDFYYNPETNALNIKRKMLIFKSEINDKLPDTNYIAIVNVKASQNLYAASISSQTKELLCQVNLIHQNSKKRFTKLLTTKKEEALKLALEISEKINKPVLDKTTGEKKWLNK